MICESCGGALSAGDQFCGECGQPVPTRDASAAPRPVAPPPAPAALRLGAPKPPAPLTPRRKNIPQIPEPRQPVASLPEPRAVPPPQRPATASGRPAAAIAILLALGAGAVWRLRSGSVAGPASTTAVPADRRFSSSRVFTQADPSERLKMLHAALVMYAQAHNGMIPPELKDAAGIRDALGPYVKEDAVFTDPRFDLPFVANPLLGGTALATGQAAADPVVFCGAREGLDGMRTAITLNGTIRAVVPEDCSGQPPR